MELCCFVFVRCYDVKHLFCWFENRNCTIFALWPSDRVSDIGRVTGYDNGFKDEACTNISSPLDESESKSVALGKIIYTDYFFIFQCAGLILLIAMIGSIVLTLRKRPHVKRQSVITQIYRDPNTSIEVIDVKPGDGI